MNVLTLNDSTSNALPQWKRTLLFTEQGEIYIPCTSTGKSELTIKLLVGFDAEEVAIHNDHLYVPLKWAEYEFPNRQELFDLMKAQVANRLSA